MRRLAITAPIAAAALLFAALGAHAATPSADAGESCNPPHGAVRERICHSPYAKLRQIDHDLRGWLERALDNNAPRREQLLTEQRAWLQTLDSCVRTDPAEPTRYVCDRVRGPIGRQQCQRDFCLVKRYSERARELHHLATVGLPGRYVLATRWPSGIRPATQEMANEDLPLCRSVAADIAHLEPMKAPLQPALADGLSVPWTPVGWQHLDQARQLSIAIELESTLRRKWGNHPEGPVVSSDTVELLRARLRSGEALVSVSAQPEDKRRGAPMRDSFILVRYQRWGPKTVPTGEDMYAQMEFFRADDPYLSSFTALGTADDAFRFRHDFEFVSLAERGFDDQWQPLPLQQPVLQIRKLVSGEDHPPVMQTACLFAYTGELPNPPPAAP